MARYGRIGRDLSRSRRTAGPGLRGILRRSVGPWPRKNDRFDRATGAFPKRARLLVGANPSVYLLQPERQLDGLPLAVRHTRVRGAEAAIGTLSCPHFRCCGQHPEPQAAGGPLPASPAVAFRLRTGVRGKSKPDPGATPHTCRRRRPLHPAGPGEPEHPDAGNDEEGHEPALERAPSEVGAVLQNASRLEPADTSSGRDGAGLLVTGGFDSPALSSAAAARAGPDHDREA